MTAYNMAVNNVASYIRSNPANAVGHVELNAFTASFVLSVAFCKGKEEILTDIIKASITKKDKNILVKE